jgi:hypothetical protein
MKRTCYLVGTFVAIAAIFTTPAAHAFFHLWRFSEFFSNADGSVQFIELRSTSGGENFAQGAQIRSASTGKTFTFPSNLVGSTFNKNLLIATSGFGALPGGVTPDFTLPSANFFNPAGDTMTLFAGSPIDVKTFSSIPTNGMQSRVYPSNTIATNSPTNFAGATGSVNLAPPPSPTGDYNGNGQVDAADYVVWRDTLNETVTAGQGADGNASGTIDDADYEFWQARFGNMVPATARGASVPESTTTTLVLAAVVIAAARRWRRPVE